MALLLVLLAAGCGSAAMKPAAQSAPGTYRVQTVKRALVTKLKQEELTFRWVACVRNGRTYRNLPIVRCNVNFGMDPHVEAYCAVLDQGRLLTNHENSAIPCGHDNAGFTVPVATS